MTNLFYAYEPGKPGYLRALRMAREIGFDVMDLNMCPMQRGESELCEDDNWERYTDEIGEEAARLGITFVQSHPPYPKALTRRKSAEEDGCEKNELFVRMTRRAIEIDARLGIPWAVMHPVSCAENQPEADVEYNYEIYAPLLEIGAARGVGLAFENMTDLDGRRRFGAAPEDLLAIIDRFGSAKTGACWDFGHGNRAFSDQLPQLKKLTGKLVCTHVDDNIGQTDLHQLPYMGTVKWEKAMALLKEMDYQGAFIYEISLMKKLPEPLKVPMAEYAYKLAEYLLSL